MPIYEYRCLNGHQFEVMRRFSDPPVEACDECGEAVQKVLTAPAIHFKGSGFHNTDYGRGSAGRATEGGEAKPSASDAGSDKASTASGDSSSPAASTSGSKGSDS